LERERLVRRNTLLLAAAQGLIQVAFPVMLVVGSVAAVDLTGRDSAAGVLFALYFVAAAAAAVGQMAMVAVMGVTPVALDHHGDSGAAISGVISLHIAGMFAFSPLIGAALDRWGRRPGLLAGAAMSCAGALVASTAGGAFLVGVGLLAIGLGWSATYLGATAVISDITAPTERGGALGFTDLLIGLGSAGAGLAAGFVFEGAGFRVLGVAVAALVGAVLVGLLRLREPAPAVPVGEIVADEVP